MPDYGSFYSQKGACALLNLTEEQLEEETRTRPLLAIMSGEDKVLYPAFQFIIPQERLSPVLTALLAKMKPWNVFFSLVSPLSHFNERRAIDIISSHEDLTPFLEYIESLEYNNAHVGEF